MTTTYAVSTDVVVQWELISPEWWKARGCLYAILAPHTVEMLYLGIAWGSTVRQRWNYATKADLWDWIEKLGHGEHYLIVGDFILRPENRLSKQLAFAVESLLIHSIKPPGNIQSMQSYTPRPGLRVYCDGRNWHERPRRFGDWGR